MSKRPSNKLDPNDSFDLYIKLRRKYEIALAKAKVIKKDLVHQESQLLAQMKAAGQGTVKRKGVTFALIYDVSVKSCADLEDVVAGLKAAKRSDMLSANFSKLKAWVKGRCGTGDDYDAGKLPKPMRAVLSIEPFSKLSATGIK